MKVDRYRLGCRLATTSGSCLRRSSSSSRRETRPILRPSRKVSNTVDGKLFDRITRILAGSAPRRATLRATAATALAGMSASIGREIAEAKKKGRKKRCRGLRQICGGRKKCCNGSGLVKCREVTDPLKPQCDGVTGRRCCGLDGAKCNANKDDCQCCEGLRCKLIVPEGVNRCGDALT